MKLTPADFIGNWTIAREITDFRILETGTLTGTASFADEGDGLRYHERGELRFAGSAPVLAERGYRWVFGAEAVQVFFADGAPFHSFPLTGAPDATDHPCGDDLYRGGYSFVRWPEWSVTWNVEGPRKKYRSVTSYSPA